MNILIYTKKSSYLPAIVFSQGEAIFTMDLDDIVVVKQLYSFKEIDRFEIGRKMRDDL